MGPLFSSCREAGEQLEQEHEDHAGPPPRNPQGTGGATLRQETPEKNISKEVSEDGKQDGSFKETIAEDVVE